MTRKSAPTPRSPLMSGREEPPPPQAPRQNQCHTRLVCWPQIQPYGLHHGAMMSDQERIQQAVALILDVGWVDGDHHKTWVLDQTLRVLLGDDYWQKIDAWEDAADGAEWETGMAP